MVDLSQVAVCRGQETVNLIGPALGSASCHPSVQQATQARKAPVALTGHLTHMVRLSEEETQLDCPCFTCSICTCLYTKTHCVIICNLHLTIIRSPAVSTNLLCILVRTVHFGEEIGPEFILRDKHNFRLSVFPHTITVECTRSKKTTFFHQLSIRAAHLEGATGSGVVGHTGGHPLHGGQFTLKRGINGIGL